MPEPAANENTPFIPSSRLGNGQHHAHAQPGEQAIIHQPDGKVDRILQQVDRLARFNEDVLITGETGVGKEGIAHRLHRKSARSGNHFVCVNCSSIPEGLLESELFGHEKGSFTSAQRQRIGKFEQANGGTIFLDEIGDMPLDQQAKLLRVLQERQFERVGGNEPVAFTGCIVAATNKDLQQEVKSGNFRKDLYYRLTEGQILHLPPLRERHGDIGPLAKHFIAQKCGRLGINLPPSLSAEAVTALEKHPWPGNVRELKAVIGRAVYPAMDSPDNVIKAGMLELETTQQQSEQPQYSGRPKDSFGYKVAKHREDQGWNQAQLAKKVSERTERVFSAAEVDAWEANQVPEKEVVDILAYLLIAQVEHSKDRKIELLKQFHEAADAARNNPAEPTASQFGIMLRELRQKANLSPGELAQKASALSPRLSMDWEDIWLIEGRATDNGLTPQKTLALVQALDRVHPLSANDKIDLYERARESFGSQPSILELKAQIFSLLQTGPEESQSSVALRLGLARPGVTHFLREERYLINQKKFPRLREMAQEQGNQEKFDALWGQLLKRLEVQHGGEARATPSS